MLIPCNELSLSLPESHCSTPETNTTWQITYTSAKNKVKKKSTKAAEELFSPSRKNVILNGDI